MGNSLSIGKELGRLGLFFLLDRLLISLIQMRWLLVLRKWDSYLDKDWQTWAVWCHQSYL